MPDSAAAAAVAVVAAAPLDEPLRTTTESSSRENTTTPGWAALDSSDVRADKAREEAAETLPHVPQALLPPNTWRHREKYVVSM